MTDGLRFEIEWIPGLGSAGPEIASTWARLEIWVSDRCVTLVEDRANGSARRSVYGSVYPLAEWIAFNWWQLLHHTRPAGLRPTEWTYARLGPRASHVHAWLRHHNLRGIGDGQSWPDLAIVPEGETTRLSWSEDEQVPDHRPVRFLARGQDRQPSEDVAAVLKGVVDRVLIRLEEQGIRGTPLQKEWQALTKTDGEETEFCVAAAKLGLDPYAISEETASLILEVDSRLDKGLHDDFLDNARPQTMRASLQWVEQAMSRLEHAQGPDSGPGRLRPPVAAQRPLATEARRPWDVGWAQANAARAHFGLRADDRIDTDEFVQVQVLDSPDPRLEGLGADSEANGAALVVGRRMGTPSRRFAQARTMWNLFHRRDARHFLIVQGLTFRHRVERAFAAELLAPALGVFDRLGDADGPVTEDQLEATAEHFGVSSQLIRHQVENQLGMEVAPAY